LCFSVGKPARIAKAGGDFFVAVELGEVDFLGNGDNEHFAAFFRVADAPNFYARTLAGEQPKIGVDVLRVIEHIRRADDVMEKRVGRRNAGAERKMVDKFCAEKGFRRELLDLFGVLGVIGDGARFGLAKAGRSEQTE